MNKNLISKITGLWIIVLFAICGAVFAQRPPKGNSAPRAEMKSISVSDNPVISDTGLGAGGATAEHIFPQGQCTQYAALTVKSRFGKPINFGGNAKDWYANAKTAGWRVSTLTADIRPDVVIVFGATDGNKYGHVAIVESRNGSDEITLSESNFSKPLQRSTRKIKLSELSRLKFIGVILP